MTYRENIGSEYLERLKTLGLPTRKPCNEWTVLHMYGDGERASTKFNFQVYRNQRGDLTLVTNDYETLQQVLKGKKRFSEEGKRLITIDDAGWGFPLGGVLCGAYDSESGQFYQGEVGVEYFQGRKFEEKLYLDSYEDRAIEIVDKIGPDKGNTIIRVCTGFINTKAKEALRQRDFPFVEVDGIGDPLQTWLENQYRRYIRDLVGIDIYFNPKDMPRETISKRFNEVVELMKSRNLLHMAKTGWKYFRERF